MRLISCHIESFGKLVDKDLSFDGDFCPICAENGSGKTTFAAFVKAMLYGLPSNRVKDSNRKKYSPWSAGTKPFGGTLIFEDGGKQYRLERVFSVAKDTSDECRLFLNTTHEEIECPESVGEHFLGVDEPTFERSLLLVGSPYNHAKGAKADNGSIIKKLSGILSAEDDAERLARALESLTDKKKSYKALRGDGGTLNRLSLERDECFSKLARLERLSQTLAQNGDKISKLTYEDVETKKRLAEYDAEYKRALDVDGMREKLVQKNRALSEFEDAKKEYDEMSSLFTRDIPTKEEIERARTISVKLDSLEQDARSLVFSSEKETRLSYLSSLDISDDDISKLGDIATAQRDVGRDIERLSSDPAYISLSKKYFDGKGSAKTVKKPSIGWQLALSVFVLLIGTGLAFFAPMVGFAIILVSMISAGIFAFLYLKKMSEYRDEISISEREYSEYLLKSSEINKLSTKRFELENAYLSICTKYKVASLDELRALVGERDALFAEKENNRSRLDAVQNESATLRERLDDLLSVTATIGDNYQERLSCLTDRISELKYSHTKLDLAKKALSEFDDFDICEEDLTDVRTQSEVRRDIDACRAECERIAADLKSAQNERSALEAEIDKVPELEEELAAISEKIVVSTKNYEAIELAIDYLKKAAKELEEGYLPKMQTAFDGYFEMFKQDSVPACFVGRDLAVSYSEAGKTRELSSESSGLRDVIELCARLSLADALFEGKRAFVLMDDPFINLDDKNIEAAVRTLSSFSQKFQIIYMTCSTSRMPSDNI